MDKIMHSILLIDDEPDVRDAYSLMLEDRGYTVHTAGSQKEALEVLRKHPVSLCLLDLKMKNENGLDISLKLKEMDSLLKIIILTAYPTHETAVEAIKMGVFDYVSKTTDPQSILEKIEAALEARQTDIDARTRKSRQNKKNIVLVCHHMLIKEGIEKLCDDFQPYHLLHTYHSHQYIKESDFNNRALLVLLCKYCCKLDEHEKPEQLFAHLNTFFPNGRMAILNSDYNDKDKIDFFKNGVRGFLPKNIDKNEMKQAFDALSAGRLWASRELTDKLLNELLGESLKGKYNRPDNLFKLSRREIEILEIMASGLSNAEICEKLFISENTVKVHINHIFKKLKVHTRTQAVMKAVKANII